MSAPALAPCPRCKSEPPLAPSAASPAPMAPADAPSPPGPPLSGGTRTYADGLRRGAKICRSMTPDDDGSAAGLRAVIAALEDAEEEMEREALASGAAQPLPSPPAPGTDAREERLAARLCAAWGGGGPWQMPVACRTARDFLAMADELALILDERTGRENGR